ncbi:MAG TPA: flippase [Nitrososphaeria archaeon]|nr:flippase [Nitrososphaeria archaeon]
MSSERQSLVELGVEAVKEGYGLFIGNTLSTLILAIGSIVIARLLGSENYGVYSLSFIIPSMLVLFTSLGIDQSLIKYVSEYSSKKLYSSIRGMFQASLLFKLVVGATTTIMIYLLAEPLASNLLNRPYMSSLIKISSLLILFQALYTLCSNFFIGFGKASMAGALATLQALVKVSLIIVLLILGFQTWGAVFGHVFGYVVAAIIGLFISTLMIRGKKGFNEHRPVPQISFIKPLISYGLPLYASTIFTVMAQQYNNLVLARYASNAQVGSYMAAMNLSMIIMLVSTPIATILYPSFSKIEVIGRDRLARAFELAVRYSILLIAPTAIFVSAFSENLVIIVYGKTFTSAIPYLFLYAAFCSIIPLLSVEMSYFNGVGLPKKTLTSTIISFLLILPLSPILAHFLSVIGVILAIIIAKLAAIIYATNFIVKKEMIRFNVHQILKIYLASLASAAISLMIARVIPLHALSSLIIGGILFLTLYVTFIALFKTLDEGDYYNLSEILGGLRFVGRLAEVIISYMRFIDGRFRRSRKA